LGSVVVASLLLTIFSNKILEADRPFSEAFLERLYLAKRAGDIVVKNPLIGVGLNNYILNLPRSDVVGFSWELQPVHNIFLLTFSEVGLIGLLVFTLLLAKGLQNSKGLVFWALFRIRRPLLVDSTTKSVNFHSSPGPCLKRNLSLF